MARPSNGPQPRYYHSKRDEGLGAENIEAGDLYKGSNQRQKLSHAERVAAALQPHQPLYAQRFGGRAARLSAQPETCTINSGLRNTFIGARAIIGPRN